MLSPALLALALVLIVLSAAPAGRLRRSGWSQRAAGGYLVAMLALGLVAAEVPSAARYLVPILILAFVTPYLAARLGIGRLSTRPTPTIVVERPEIKRVHGPARDVAPGDRQRDAEPAETPGPMDGDDRPAGE